MANKEEFGPDFRHLVRLVNTDLDGKKNVGTALAYVPGVGKRLAYIVCREANVDPSVRIGNLKDPEIEKVTKPSRASPRCCPRGWSTAATTPSPARTAT